MGEVGDVVGSVGEVRRERWRRSSEGWKCFLGVYSGRMSKCDMWVGGGSGFSVVEGMVAWRCWGWERGEGGGGREPEISSLSRCQGQPTPILGLLHVDLPSSAASSAVLPHHG